MSPELGYQALLVDREACPESVLRPYQPAGVERRMEVRDGMPDMLPRGAGRRMLGYIPNLVRDLEAERQKEDGTGRDRWKLSSAFIHRRAEQRYQMTEVASEQKFTLEIYE